MNCPKSSYQDFESQPFLDSAIQEVKHESSRTGFAGSVWTFRWTILAHAFLISIYTSIFFASIGYGLIYNDPLTGTLPGRPTDFLLAAESPYAGPRTNESDEAWASLLAGINVRARREEVKSRESDPVILSDGSALAWPEGMHQLHCVKRIREWVYRDQYHPNLDLNTALEKHWMVHIDHCIELLRQSVMCNPDRSWMGFHWEDANGDRPTLDLRGTAEHDCVDWDVYVAEMRERSVSRDEMGEIRRPKVTTTTTTTTTKS